MYNSIIIEHFTNPRNAGALKDYNAIINTGNPVCDDRLSIWVAIKDNVITKTGQKAYGCATSLATASIFSEYIKGKSVETLEQIQDVSQLAKEQLGELEPSQMHCYDIFEELHENLIKNLVTNVL